MAFAGVQQSGSIRGVVYDRDFDAPLAGVRVTIAETGQRATTSDQGNYVFPQVLAGRYTLVFAKEGYLQQVKADVVVSDGQLADVDASLPGEFTELEEFVVQDILAFGAGTESALLQLRFESPALLDSIGSDFMGRAGASDAASALRLVAGASVQDGKFAVIRGLPDRYVSSQMNGVRLPTADEDKRAVELDQFPATVIESIQVSKTFMPDQQGDASGGAVDVRLKGIPDEFVFQLKSELSWNSQVRDRDDFLTYEDGGVSSWGRDNGDRDIQPLGANWDGAVGTSEEGAPRDYKLSGAIGGKRELGGGWKVGLFASMFFERDSSFYDDGIDDSLWVENPGEGLTPEYTQGSPSSGDFKTSLFDVTQGSELVQWGGLVTAGLENESNFVGVTYLVTNTTEDTATLAINTRGKEHYFPGYDPGDPMDPGNEPSNLLASPYLRFETLQYTERSTSTLQLNGRHTLPLDELELGDSFTLLPPELDWVFALSSAELDQPDKRVFGAIWMPPSFNPGFPPFLPPFTSPPVWLPYKPSAQFTLGNLQRIYEKIEEDSTQYALNAKLPFEAWSGEKGFLKAGWFSDELDRDFNQDTFSNFDDNSSFNGGFDEPWSGVFPDENHPITASLQDVDYEGELDVSAWYSMLDLPLFSWLSVVGGVCVESTDISIVNFAEQDATWFPPGATTGVDLLPGQADVTFEQDDLLPAFGLELEPLEQITLRAAYSETVARQTFKELTPILQQEYLGGPVFIGNPGLGMSSLKNYDLRLDYRPYQDSLVSVSYFYKDVDDPIEYVQRFTGFTFTTPVNYPEGKLSGWELEVRQGLGRFWDRLEGLGVGANATFIDSEVTLTDAEIAEFASPGVNTPMTKRDMTNAPEHLFNFYVTYDVPVTRSQLSVFYTIQGDTLVAGAGVATGNFVPDVYAKQYDTLNVSVTQPLGEHFKLILQAKNLTNPDIETVYRSDFTGGDVTKTRFTRGIDYSVALAAEFRF